MQIRISRGRPILDATILLLVLLFFGPAPIRGEDLKPSPVKVAAVQFNPQLGRHRANVERLARQFEKAAQQGAKILVAPEMATTGYLYRDRQDIASVVEPIPGPTTKRFEQIARRFGCYLVWGMPERDEATGLFYNSAAIVGPEGFVGKYRKTHLWEAEAHWAAWGDLGVPVFETRFGRVALLICQDANYVETFRLAALKRADIVCFSTNSSGQTIAHLQARAIQNGLFVISANRSDAEVDRYNGKPFQMKGCSAIWNPVGLKLAEAKLDEEDIVTAQIHPAAFPTQARRLSERRPQIYHALGRHVAPWNLRATEQPHRIEAVAVQYRAEPGQIQENRQTIERMLSQRLNPALPEAANSPDMPSRLIVLPELSLVGKVSAKKMTKLAEPLDGPTCEWAAKLARRYRAFVVCGLPEREGRKFYNAAIVIDPAGKQIAHARKMHLNAEDRQWAAAGDQWVVIECEGLGRLGLLIGDDSYIAESGTIMAIHRADVVAVPASWHGEIAGNGAIAIHSEINPHADRNAMVLWDDMAWGQQFYVVVANSAADADHMGGKSGIYSTDPIYGIASRDFASTNREEVVRGRFETLNGNHPDHWIDQKHYIGSRRPDAIYYPLLAPAKAKHPVREPTSPAVAP